MNWLKIITDLVFPYRCVSCGKYLDDEYLCRACLNALPIKNQAECIGCNQPTPMGKTCAFCKDRFSVDQILVASDFKDPAVANIIKSFKYKFIPDLARPLGELMKRYFNKQAQKGNFSIIQDNPLVIPVPLYRKREYWRGFNQAKLLAEILARHYRLDISECIVRVADRTPQAQLENKEERFSNVLDLFKCQDTQSFKNRKVILIDDVCTTGATMNECARLLKDFGASKVIAVAIARG